MVNMPKKRKSHLNSVTWILFGFLGNSDTHLNLNLKTNQTGNLKKKKKSLE